MGLGGSVLPRIHVGQKKWAKVYRIANFSVGGGIVKRGLTGSRPVVRHIMTRGKGLSGHSPDQYCDR